jgi:NAD(P) transhydrogenase subunit alpha
MSSATRGPRPLPSAGAARVRFSAVNVVIPAETLPGERRVAALPDVVAQLSAAGLQVRVQAGAGRARPGLRRGVRRRRARRWWEAVERRHGRRPPARPAAALRPRSPEAAPGCDHDRVLRAVDRAGRRPGICATGGSPRSRWSWCRGSPVAGSRWTRSTSQALIAGYRCVPLRRRMRLPRFFPLFMTAAGPSRRRRSSCWGAGVAGCRPSPPPSAWARWCPGTTSAAPPRRRGALDGRHVRHLDLEALEGAGGYAGR